MAGQDDEASLTDLPDAILGMIWDRMKWDRASRLSFYHCCRTVHESPAINHRIVALHIDCGVGTAADWVEQLEGWPTPAGMLSHLELSFPGFGGVPYIRDLCDFLACAAVHTDTSASLLEHLRRIELHGCSDGRDGEVHSAACTIANVCPNLRGIALSECGCNGRLWLVPFVNAQVKLTDIDVAFSQEVSEEDVNAFALLAGVAFRGSLRAFRVRVYSTTAEQQPALPRTGARVLDMAPMANAALLEELSVEEDFVGGEGVTRTRVLGVHRVRECCRRLHTLTFGGVLVE